MSAYSSHPCSMHRSIKLAWFSLLLLWQTSLLAQYPSLVNEWDRDFGGTIWEDLHAMEQTSDGGYILAGFSSSSMTGDVSEPTRGQGDFWAVKTDDQGLMLWEKRYGGAGMELPFGVLETADGGYLFAGWSESDIGGEKSENGRGYYDYWLVKTDALGVPEWDRTYGGDSTDLLYELIQTSDGGYMIGGISQSGASGERSSPRIGDFDWWVLKLDVNGDIQWERSYGGDQEDRLNGIRQDTDGNFVIGGGTRSGISGDITTPLRGVKDFWFVKVDQFNGDIIWQRRYGGTDEDEIQSFTLTSDGGYLLAGGSRSDAYLPDKKDNSRGIVDVWVVKTDAAGNILWEHTFGGPGLENCYSVKENVVGHYLLGGYSDSDAGPDKTENSKGGYDYWLIYLDPDGNKLWDKTLGGDQHDVLENLFQTNDGGYLLGGHSQSGISGDKGTTNKGLNDYWVIKTVCNLTLDIPDAQTCPGIPVSLNAYDPNCIACEWEWNDGNADSIRMVAPLTTTTYSVTLTDGVGCARFAEVTVSVDGLPLDLGPDEEICAGQSINLDAGSGYTYDWSTSQLTQIITVNSPGSYSVTITDINGCTNADTINISLSQGVSVDLGPDTSFCSGASIFLDAGSSGNTYNWTPGGNSQLLEVSQAGTYIVEVGNNANCSGRDTIEVVEYEPPAFTNLQLSCNNTSTHYTVSFEISGGDPGSYQVSGDPGNLLGNVFTSSLIPKNQPYTFYLDDIRGCGPEEISGNYDCICQTTATQLEDNLVVVCGASSFEVNIDNTASLDANDLLLYMLHDGDALNIGTILDTRPTPKFDWLPGQMSFGVTYFVTPIAGNDNGNGSIDQQDGCLSIGRGVPVIFVEPPVALVNFPASNIVTCQQPNIFIDGSTSTPIGSLNFQWSVVSGGNIVSGSQSEQVEINRAGDYQLIVTDQTWGCSDTTGVSVLASDDIPQAIIDPPGKITCQDSVVQLDATSSSIGPEFEYLWSGGAIQGNTTLTPSVNQAGDYQLLITNNLNGCKDSMMVSVIADTLAPSVDAGQTMELSCDTEEVTLSGSFSASGVATYSWTTANGHFLMGEQSLSPTVDAPGTYILEVIDTDNGCRASDEAVVRISDNQPSSAIMDIADPSCFDTEDGFINVQQVIGGTAPYVYALNGENFSDGSTFSNLSAGTYQLILEDVNGCVWDTVVTLVQPPPLVVSLGLDQEIRLGDSIQLKPQTNVIPTSFVWLNDELADCTNCWWPWVRPQVSSLYTIEVSNDTGCKESASVQIFVRKERNVYIPSAFSPNGDGINERLTVYGDGSIQNIKAFRIFNRWGAPVFELKNFLPNDELVGWDGSYRGKLMDNGVYVFYAEIEFIDGHVEVYKGDVTIAK